MTIDNLPVGKTKAALALPHFPTKWLAVIWRNWGLVKLERIADVLKTTPDIIASAAGSMGLEDEPLVMNEWLQRGYITIIRNNWHLLSYKQLLILLDWNAEKLDFILREDDFLWTKLGALKPDTGDVVYTPLSDEEKQQLAWFKSTFSPYMPLQEREKPFSFLNSYKPVRKRENVTSDFELNFLYSYHAVYGDALLEPELDPYPDELLEAYASIGVNGIWLQGLLYTLYPLEPELSRDYDKRIQALNTLVQKAEKYGIKVYLYLNEPRGMTEAFFDHYPEWKGVHHSGSDVYSLCTSNQEVLDYLEQATAYVFQNVKGLGGVFCITMSENATNCHSRWQGHNCPKCSERPVSTVIADVITAIAKGVHSEAPEAKVMCHTWAWAEHTADTIALLPEQVELLSVSEWGKEFEHQGIKGSVIDYSISVVGPADEAVKSWRQAQERGINTVAKVQLNNSWECSAVPYIPVPYLIKEHLENLKKIGITGLMSSWTLGGYPSWNLELTSVSVAELAESRFGKALATQICDVWHMFSDAFREFPFLVDVIYTSPVNFGPMSLFFKEKTGYAATMIGFPYDDLDKWRGIYSAEVFEDQFRMLCSKWLEGLKSLRELSAAVPEDRQESYRDLLSVSEAAYCHFKSTLNHIRFVQNRDHGDSCLLTIIDDEISVVEMLLKVMLSDSRIGFEASNHYYYTKNDLLEKILNLKQLKINLRT